MLTSSTLDPDQIDWSQFTASERVVVEEFVRRKGIQAKGNSFLDFVQHVAPWVIIEEVHVLIARHFEMLKRMEIERLMINMPPRTGKSLFTSELMPAWWEGHFATDKILHAAYATTLVEKFGRKIRNMIASPEYREVFPKTIVTKDSRAAAQWATTAGGEYNAVGVGSGVAGKGGNLCLSPRTNVWVRGRGRIAARLVLVGDSLLSWHGWAEVLAKVRSAHAGTVTVGPLCVTAEHPIWTANRGWVDAGHLSEKDLLWTMTVYATIQAHLQQGVSNGLCKTRYVAYTYLQHLGVDVAAMHQSAGRQLRAVRWAGSECLRAVARLWCVLQRYGRYNLTGAHAGPQGQRHRLFAGELPVVGCGDAEQQPSQQRAHHSVWADTVSTSMGAENRSVAGSNRSQDICNGAGPGDGADSAAHEPQPAQGNQVKLRWFRRLGVRVAGVCGAQLARRSDSGREVEKVSVGGALAWQAANYLCGILLGVRAAGDVKVENHEGRWFVNFMVDGDNTFIGDNILSHNCIIDDPMSEQDMFSKNVMDSIYEWYGAGFYTRRQPDRNVFLLTQTRWSVGDLSGRLIADAVTKPEADQWTVLTIPAVVDQKSADALNACSNDLHITQPHFYRAGDSFSPRRWPMAELMRTKSTVSRKAWASLYMQSPVEEGGGILRRDDWKPWGRNKELPGLEYILQAYDTAFEEGEQNDFSARITWGVFKRASDNKLCVLMLERMKERLTFSKLLENALQAYNEYQPDRVIIEKAASGAPLIQEMRKRGIPVSPIRPVGSKIARANAASVVLEQGVVYYPEGMRWAEDVIEECAAFPNGQHDDVPDVVAHSLVWFRRTFLLETPDDVEDEDDDDKFDDAPKRTYAVRRTRMPQAA